MQPDLAPPCYNVTVHEIVYIQQEKAKPSCECKASSWVVGNASPFLRISYHYIIISYIVILYFYICIHIYVHIYMCVCVYIYVYVYIYRESPLYP